MSPARRVVLGRVGRTHGLEGEVVVRGASLAVADLSRVAQLLLVGPGTLGERPIGIRSARPFGPDLLVCFDGVESLEQAAAEPERDEIYVYDLIGLVAVDESGRELGVVREVLSTGAHDVLEIVSPGADPERAPILVPYRPEFVLGWEPEARRLRLRVPAGLEDVYRS